MKKQLVIAVISVVAAAGCGSKNTSSGNGELQNSGSGSSCSTGYVDSFNQLYANLKEVASYYDDNGHLTADGQAHPATVIAAYKGLDNSCDAFLGPYSNVSCAAVRGSDGNLVEVKMDTVKSVCAEVKTKVHSMAMKTAETTSEANLPVSAFQVEADAFHVEMK